MLAMIPIPKMPSRLRGLFCNDDEERLRQVAFHLGFVDKMHDDLSTRLSRIPPEVYIIFIYFCWLEYILYSFFFLVLHTSRPTNRLQTSTPS